MPRLPKAAGWVLCLVVAAVVTGLAGTAPAEARPADEPTAFQWDDQNNRTAFLACMRMVDWVVHGQDPAETYPFALYEPPSDVSQEDWELAMDREYFDDDSLTGSQVEFVYRPECNVFLPADWTSRVPAAYRSGTYDRCLDNLNETDEPRPNAVPAWYWELSMEKGTCYLLLPVGAFGYTSAEVAELEFVGYPDGIDRTRWSSWTPADDPELPEGADDPNLPTRGDYEACLDFIDWRMATGADPGDDPLTDTYNDPPNSSVSASVWHQAIDFYLDHSAGSYDATSRKTIPANWLPDCDLILVAGVEDIDPDTGGFQWDDPNMRTAFQACMQLVDWVAHGREGDQPVPVYDVNLDYSDSVFPGGVDQDTWYEAVHEDYFDGIRIQEFTYRPKCHTLLPADYTSRVPIRYWSETFSRCLANVSTGERTHERPLVVPAWYWEVSMEIGDCHLLLPLGAFGLGEDENAWSQWSADDETDYPTTHDNPDLVTEYNHCKDFINWRMDGAATFPGLGSLYDDPPEQASPPRVWHEALNYYADPASPGGEATVPADWRPNCGLLLLFEECQPSTDSLIPEGCYGPHATSHYDIGYSEYDDPEADEAGAGTPSLSRNFWGGLTGLVFQLSKGSVQVALWMVDWAYTFDIGKYDVLALEVGDAYQDNLLGRSDLHLRELLWLVLFGWAGFMALRGRLAIAGSEILLTVVLLLVSGVLMSQRDMYMTSTWELMDETSTAVLVAGMGADPGEGDAVAHRRQLVESTQREVHRIFIEDPYDHLNWGRSLGDPNDPDNPLRECAAARYFILSGGPHGSDPWPRAQMAELGGDKCADLVEFNRNPSGIRFLGALLVLVSGALVAVLLGLVGLTIVVGKFVALLLFAVAPFAALVTILPGGGRRLAWSWMTTLVQVVIAVIGVSFLLSLLLLTLRALIGLTGDIPLIERFLLMNLVVVVVFGARRSLLASGQRFATHLREYLSATRGSGATWAGTAASASGGLDLLNADRWAGAAAGGPLVAAYQRNLAIRRAKYTARLGYKNLQAISRWKRTENARNRRLLDVRRHAPDDPWVPIRRQPLP